MTPILLSLVLGAAPASSAEAVQRYALLVGANDGGAERVTLQYAHHDVRGLSQILTDLGGVEANNRFLLYDPNAQTLSNALEELHQRLGEAEGRSEVIFYYSGHSDEEGLLLGQDHFGYPQLRKELEELPADVRIAILDSCASGAMVRAKGGSRVAPFLVDQSNKLDGFAIITSSAADEVAQEADRIGGSYFTHYLTTGLRGAADMSQDGRVTLDEAYAYAHAETLARTERSQHGPQHANRGGGLDGQGQLVLTDLQLTTASLVLDEQLDGRALIRDDDGDLVAELLKPQGRAVELGLGAGHYDVVFNVRDSDRYAATTVTLVTGQSTLLSRDDFRWYESEASVARGDLAVPAEAAEEPPQASVIASQPRKLGPRFQFSPGIPPAPEGVDSLVVGFAGARSRSLDGIATALGAVVVDQTSQGAAVSLGANTAGDLQGLQLSLGANSVWRGGEGAQVTIGANVVANEFGGVQAAVGGNIVGQRMDGTQVAVGYNHAGAGLNGWQAAVGANAAMGDSEGLQTAVGGNLARDMDGMQAAVGLNVARTVRGLQWGGLNVARDVRGLQLGLVNIGRDVNGGQIGLVNVARDVDGVSLGLLSFEKEGRHDLLVYANETDALNFDFKLGGDHLYTVLAAGAMPGEHGWVGLGYGGHATFGKRLWMDIDALWQTYTPLTTMVQSVDGQAVTFEPFAEVTQVARGRVSLGLQIARQFALFGGVQMSVRLPISDRQMDLVPSYLANGNEEVLAWPGAFAGVQF